MNFFDVVCFVHSLSDHDKLRALQCIYCEHDPGTCNCTEKDEDEKGMCKKYIGGKNEVSEL